MTSHTNKRKTVDAILAEPAVREILLGARRRDGGLKTLTDAAAEDRLRAEEEGRQPVTQPTLTKYLQRLATHVQDVPAAWNPAWGDLATAMSTLQRRAGRQSRPKSRGSKTVHTYPVYGKVQAGDWNGSDQHDGEQTGTYYTDLDLPARGEEPYALKVSGLSMTDNAATVEFPEGSFVLIDPATEPRPGDFVVAFDVTDQSTTFKKFARLPDGSNCLRPLNPAYPTLPLTEYHQILGVVAEAFLPLYRR
jgi:SOS-response transcriptional repressor LexA